MLRAELRLLFTDRQFQVVVEWHLGQVPLILHAGITRYINSQLLPIPTSHSCVAFADSLFSKTLCRGSTSRDLRHRLIHQFCELTKMETKHEAGNIHGRMNSAILDNGVER